MKLKNCLVVTSIYDGSFLKDYSRQILSEKIENDCCVIVIPDRKTDPKLFSEVKAARKKGIAVECPDLGEQERFLKKLGAIHKIIPYDSDNRRNIGYLLALEKHCDYLISIDDDNLCLPGSNFFKEHAVVCEESAEFDSASSSNGWLNICELLVTEPSPVYPRGFPYHSRFTSPEIKFHKEKGRVHINAGLWLETPDVDAATHLSQAPRVKNFRGKSVILGRNTWSPVNSQNTALFKDAVPAYYFIPMEQPVHGSKIDRFGDIFSGYFTQACARHLGYRIRFGTPVVKHLRNAHLFLDDLSRELPCIRMLEEITTWLRSVKLQGHSYSEAYLSLAENLDQNVKKFKGSHWDRSATDYIRFVARCMRIWIKSVNSLNGTNF